IAYQEWEKLPERWPHIELGPFQIMPNHMHGIIIIHAAPVRAPLAGAPATIAPATHHTPAPNLHDTSGNGAPARGAPTWTEKPTAGQIVGAYKSRVATECLKIAKSKQPEIILGQLWHRNFWEHIIRDVRAFDRISHYIIANPEKWEADKFWV
ncbi:MAG: hypothetical protein ABIQ93_02075, partial [Saprospiraceae bacterium]